MRIAVLGVGLIGGSIGLAAREHVEGAEVVGFGRDPGRLRARARAGRDRPRPPTRSREAVEGADALLRLRAGGRAARAGARRAGRRRAGLRGHGRRLDQAGAGGRDRRPALRRRPPDRRRRDRRRRARPRRPVPGRGLVPDAAADTPAGCSTSACTASWSTSARGPWRSTRPPTTGSWRCSATSRTCWPTCSPRRPPARLADHGEALRHVGPELPRHDPRSRAPTRISGPTSTAPTAARSSRRSARSGASWSASRSCSPTGDVAAWNDARPRRPARAARVRRGRRAGARAAPHRPEPPRYRRPGGARARQGRGEHRRPGAGAGLRHALGRHDALDRRRRPGRPRAPS